MFIKLTKCDGMPVWLNPEFIMRIEAWKTGSAVAVAGDGDFEVRETPSAVIALCTPPPPPAEEPPKPKARGRRKKTEEPPAENPPVAEPPVAEPPVEKAPAEEVVAAVAEQNPEPGPEPAPNEVPEPVPVFSAETLFPDAPDEVSSAAAFLKKQRCRSRKRIVNTLKSRDPKISMDDAHRMLEQMEARGFVSIDAQGHAVFN